MSNLYKYLFIKCPDTEKEIIINFFKSLLGQRIKIKYINEVMIIIYDNVEFYDFEETINSLNSELLCDIYLYESEKYNLEELDLNINIVISIFTNIHTENKYFNEKKIAFENIKNKFDYNLKKLCLKHYYKNQVMQNILRVFFESNLNTTKASKTLYMHRNTLINKLDRFIADTNFNVRDFMDAVIIYTLIKN